MRQIPFNKPYLHGRELVYIAEAVASGKISGDGIFTKRCHNFFESKYGFKKVLMTTSCTDALEMAAILLDIKPGDEVIVPSFTFVSSANAFVLRGAKIIFADSGTMNPNVTADNIEPLITTRTKAIVVVHYAGIACDMDPIVELSRRHNIPIVEDAAQAVDSFYKGVPLGSIGLMGAFSFHETKNVIAGEGGMLTLNDHSLLARAEIIREKGTNRSSFFRGEIDKYGWVDIGSSFLPSDIISAYLFAQLENLENIQNRRKLIWNKYWSILNEGLQGSEYTLPQIPDFATNNAHMFYLVCANLDKRNKLISDLKKNGIQAVFHYVSLGDSTYYRNQSNRIEFPNCNRYADCLVRLPMYFELQEDECEYVCEQIIYSARS
jgi:dTDP-4-amino-4,6-dideoxygalactose transaminase